MIAALYVERGGVYWDLPGVDPWDKERDARLYAGPHPVVAHPPCERWGRFWHGSTRKPHQYKLGEDGGCFAAALKAVRWWGGVLEHPAHSKAWDRFGLPKPPADGGWIVADYDCHEQPAGYTCHVEQGFYGHFSNKPTWLYACYADLPDLRWGRGEQRLHPVALARHGYEKARRIGMVAMIGGKDKKKIRDRTPVEFRDVLLSIAHSASPQAVGCALQPGAAHAPVSAAPPLAELAQLRVASACLPAASSCAANSPAVAEV
jgi:hypothetical protein